jgi:phage/plasmid-associated DNA primase
VGQFLEECCLRGPDLRVKKDDLYQAWRAWCQDSGESEAMRRSKKWLTYQMLAQGLEQGGAGNYSLIGIGLLG